MREGRICLPNLEKRKQFSFHSILLKLNAFFLSLIHTHTQTHKKKVFGMEGELSRRSCKSVCGIKKAEFLCSVVLLTKLLTEVAYEGADD